MTTRTFSATELDNILEDGDPLLVSTYVDHDSSEEDDHKLEVSTWHFWYDGQLWSVSIASTPFSGWLHDEYEATLVDG
jgi:hypothetical protein